MKQQEQRAGFEESPELESTKDPARPDTEYFDDAPVVEPRQADKEEDDTSSIDEESCTANTTVNVEDLQFRLKQAEEMAAMLQSRFKQMQVKMDRETDELRARLKRTADERLETAKGEMFKGMLEVADNLERAIKAAEAIGEPSTLLEGVKATLTLLLRQLETNGIKPLTAIGESFNPLLHEAVDIVEVEPARDGKVIEVYQSGYKYGEKLLRPAVVRVGRSS